MQSCSFLVREGQAPPGKGIDRARVTPGRSRREAPAVSNLPPPHVFLAWLGLKFARLKIHAERTECSRRLVGKKKVK